MLQTERNIMKLQTFWETKKHGYLKKRKQLKRKVFFLKARIFLTCVLPVAAILLAAKAVQTLFRVKLREAASAALSHDKPVKKPVVQTAEKPEFVSPVRVPSQNAKE